MTKNIESVSLNYPTKRNVWEVGMITEDSQGFAIVPILGIRCNTGVWLPIDDVTDMVRRFHSQVDEEMLDE